MPVKNIFSRLYQNTLDSLPPRISVSLDYLVCHGKWPNINAPTTFTEWIQKRKVAQHDPRYPLLANKITVKDYVRERLGDTWVIPTLWHGSELPPREQRTWPIPYVVKSAHTSGQNYFVTSPELEDWPKIEALTQKWVHTAHAVPFKEWLYAQIPPAILIEPYINFDLNVLPVDYKFFVFHGKVAYIQVDTGRRTAHHRSFYDRNWQRQSFGFGYPIDPNPTPSPSCFDEMIKGAEILGKGFDFIRVDLYEVAGKPLFGELTFYPDSGRLRFSDPKADELLGQLWEGVPAA